MERKHQAKKRVSSESAPATPATSGKKGRKRAAAQRKASAEAQRGDDDKRANKQRRMEEKCPEQKGREMAASSQKDSPSLAKSIDKAELVRRAVAHAVAAAEYFPTDQDDDEESDDDDKPGEPAIARNLKVELGQASEHTTVNLEEAPDAKEGVREALERRPIPVVEAVALPPLQVFGAHTAAQLQSDAKARASAADRATYGVGRYEADLKQRIDEAEIDQWYDDVDEEHERKEEEKHVARRHQQLQVPPPPPTASPQREAPVRNSSTRRGRAHVSLITCGRPHGMDKDPFLRVRSQAVEPERASGLLDVGNDGDMRPRLRAPHPKVAQGRREPSPHHRTHRDSGPQTPGGTTCPDAEGVTG